MPSFPANRSFERSSELQARLHDLIPGGAHAYSRGSDQYPEHMTPVLVRGHLILAEQCRDQGRTVNAQLASSSIENSTNIFSSCAPRISIFETSRT